MKLTALNSINWNISNKDYYPIDTQYVYSIIIAISNTNTRTIYPNGIKKIVVTGLNEFIKWYLQDLWNETFFNKSKHDVIQEYKSLVKNNSDISHIEKLYDLGYLPIEIKAIPEDTIIQFGNNYDKIPMYTIINTHPRFFWLIPYMEMIILSNIWKPSTISSIALKYYEICDSYSTFTCDDNTHVIFQCQVRLNYDASIIHDIINNAHLYCFKNVNNILSIDQATIKTNIQLLLNISQNQLSLVDAEKIYLKIILKNKFPNGLISYVSDTYDFYNVLEDILPELKELIVKRDGKFIIHINSLNPIESICGTWIPLPELETINVCNSVEDYFKEIEKYIHDYVIQDLNGYDINELCEYIHPNYEQSYKVIINFKNKLYCISFSVETDTEYETNRIYVVDKLILHSIDKYDHSKENIQTIGAIQHLYNIFGGFTNDKGYKVLDNHIGLSYGGTITPMIVENILRALSVKGFASSNIMFNNLDYQYITPDTFEFISNSTYAKIGNTEVNISDNDSNSACGLMVVYYDDEWNYRVKDKLTLNEYKKVDSLLKPIFLNGRLI